MHGNMCKHPLDPFMIRGLGAEGILWVKARTILGLKTQFSRVGYYETPARMQELS
jgi:hypothetical protein